MKKAVISCFLILIVITIIGCSLIALIANIGCCPNLQPFNTRDLGSSHIFTKNYNLGQEKSAYVGEEIVRLKDYYVEKKQITKMKASNDFTIWNITGSKNDEFNLVGTVEYSGMKHYVIQFNQRPVTGFLIDRYGNFTGDRLRLDGKRVAYIGKANINPTNTKFFIVELEKIDSRKGFVNYEIVYTGRDKESIKFMYREYTTSDIAKPAFYQNLTYNISSKFIRFKNLRIQIVGADDERIKYVVLEDGY